VSVCLHVWSYVYVVHVLWADLTATFKALGHVCAHGPWRTCVLRVCMNGAHVCVCCAVDGLDSLLSRALGQMCAPGNYCDQLKR